MFHEASKYYQLYYHYDIPEGGEPGEVVNSLYNPVIRNDKDALGQVLKILASNTYYLVCRRLESTGNATRDNVDEVMQNVRVEILKMAFRGFPEYVGEDNFYPYLIGVVENCVKRFRQGAGRVSRREGKDWEDGLLQEEGIAASEAEEAKNPEAVIIQEERKALEGEILGQYIEALQETGLPPYQVLTYCYAILIPQLFKKSQDAEFLSLVDGISGRRSQPPNSHYNKEKHCLEGEITRDSVILIKWAMDAMYGQKVFQLDGEFQDLYNRERLAGAAFRWGQGYRANLEKDCSGVPIRQVIITEAFQKNAIKNWPARVAQSLLAETGRRMAAKKDWSGKAVKAVEEMLR